MRTLWPAIGKALVSCVAAAVFLFVPAVLRGTDLARGRDIVLSEISYNPPRSLGVDERYEFVEVHNRGPDSMDVSGWTARAGESTQRFTIPTGTVVPPGGYLVLARDAGALRDAYDDGLAVVGDVPFALENSGDVVRLFDQEGHLVDQVEFEDDPPWHPLADGGGATLERISLIDDITDFTNFTASADLPKPGTPGAPNSRAGEIPPRHHVIINEIMYQPVKDPDEDRLRHCPQEEFLELYNRGEKTVDISGWRLGDGIDFTFPGGTTLASGKHIVLYRDEVGFQEKYGGIPNALGLYDGELANGGEELLLLDADGQPADYVDYNDGLPWPVNPDGLRGSLELVDPFSDNDRGQAWRESESFLGTPGAKNSATETFELSGANAGPQITSVIARPERDLSRKEILSDDPIRVEARVADQNGVANVVLEYQAMAPGEYIRKTDPEFETQWTPLEMRASVEMVHDGELGKYVATIPALPHRTLVRYRLIATDAAALPAESRSPFPRDPEPNYAYFVYDGVPNYVAANQSAFGPPGFVHKNLSRVPVYFIIGHPVDIHDVQFETIPESLYSLYRHRVTFVQDGQVFDHVGVRLRGSVTSRYTNSKRSWKIKFNKGNRFRGEFNDGTSFPSRRSKINIVRAFDSGLTESLALKLYREADVLASTTTFVHLRIVDSPEEHDQLNGDFFGLYLDLQAIDKVLLKDTGRPVNEESSIYKFRGFPDKKHSDCDPEDRADVETFLDKALSAEGTPEFFSENLDLHRYFSFRAATDLTENQDMDSRKNYYYYFNTDSMWWEVMPWDVDGAFRATSGDEPLMRVLARFPVQFRNRLRFLWQVIYGEARIRETLDEWQELLKEIANANTDRWGSASLESNRAYLSGRTTSLRASLLGRVIDKNIPFTPVNSFPYPDELPTAPVSLRSAPFRDPDEGETHAASRWILIGEDGDWATPLWDSETEQDLDEIVVPADRTVIGKKYLFRVAHMNSSGRWSFLSDPTSFQLGAGDQSNPSVPTNLAVDHVGFRSVVFHWSPSEDLETGILGYRILRDGDLLAERPIVGERFTDTTPRPGVRHRYQVIAVNVSGLESTPSAELDVEMPPELGLGGWRLPPGGLDYLYDANPNEDTFSDPRLHRKTPMLDGSWNSSLVSLWDGSRPGEGKPGGAAVELLSGLGEDGGPASVLSLENPDEPAVSALNNARLFFLRDIGPENALDDGVTLVARMRVNPEPLDLPGPASQDPLGRGQLGIARRAGGIRQHFSIWMHDSRINASGGVSAPVSMTEFQSVWMTLQGEDEAHRLRLFLNGGTIPDIDVVLTLSASGTESGYDGNYIEMGLDNRSTPGAVQIDYFGYKRGVHLPAGFEAERTFIRGDANHDGGLTIDDAIAVLNDLFLGSMDRQCLDSADANDSGRVNVSDAVRIIRHLFVSGAAPATPFPECGADESMDELSPCSQSSCD